MIYEFWWYMNCWDELTVAARRVEDNDEWFIVACDEPFTKEELEKSGTLINKIKVPVTIDN